MTAAVCVLLFGLIQRSVTITVNTSDGSATGEISVITYYKIFNITLYIRVITASDYSPTVTTLEYFPSSSISQVLCTNITVTNDGVVEDTEEFLVEINTTDSSVKILQSRSSVLIMDSSSKCIITNCEGSFYFRLHFFQWSMLL